MTGFFKALVPCPSDIRFVEVNFWTLFDLSADPKQYPIHYHGGDAHIKNWYVFSSSNQKQLSENF